MGGALILIGTLLLERGMCGQSSVLHCFDQESSFVFLIAQKTQAQEEIARLKGAPSPAGPPKAGEKRPAPSEGAKQPRTD